MIDCCCGQGVVTRAFAAQGSEVLGLDGAPSLIAAAQQRATSDRETFITGDAHQITDLLKPVMQQRLADTAMIILAAQDLDPLESILKQLHQLLKPGGNCALLVTHPCFRPPRQSDWGRMSDQRWCRQIASYLSPQSYDIVTHPGRSGGDSAASSTHFHRPLSYYLNSLARAGFSLQMCDEICQPWRGKAGSQQAEADRIAGEIPAWLLLVAHKQPDLSS